MVIVKNIWYEKITIHATVLIVVLHKVSTISKFPVSIFDIEFSKPCLSKQRLKSNSDQCKYVKKLITRLQTKMLSVCETVSRQHIMQFSISC